MKTVTLSGISAIARPMGGGFTKQAAGPSQPSPWALVDQGVGGSSEVQSSVMSSVLKPYFTLACVAFVVGFASYLALGWVMTPTAPTVDDWQATISAPATPATSPFVQGKRI